MRDWYSASEERLELGSDLIKRGCRVDVCSGQTMNLSCADIPLGIEQRLPLIRAVAIVINEDYSNLKYSVLVRWRKPSSFEVDDGIATHLYPPDAKTAITRYDLFQAIASPGVAGRLGCAQTTTSDSTPTTWDTRQRALAPSPHTVRAAPDSARTCD